MVQSNHQIGERTVRELFGPPRTWRSTLQRVSVTGIFGTKTKVVGDQYEVLDTYMVMNHPPTPDSTNPQPQHQKYGTSGTSGTLGSDLDLISHSPFR